MLYGLSNDAMKGGGWFYIHWSGTHSYMKIKWASASYGVPWFKCVPISSLVHLISSQCSCLSDRNPIITYSLPNTSVMCLCEQCLNYIYIFTLLGGITVSLVPCSLVCWLRKRICSLFRSHLHTSTSHPVYLCASVCCVHKYCTSVLDFVSAVAEEVFYRVYVPVSLSVCQSVQLLSR